MQLRGGGGSCIFQEMGSPVIGPTLKQELTPNQYFLCGLLALGWTHEEIARYLGRSYYGVKRSFEKIRGRSGASDKLELATRYAWERMENGL
jgi:DNA-binding NarL/FixJ family response regulator